MSRFQTIAFDADDTLWHTENSYAEAEAQFLQIMSAYHSPDVFAERLHKTEIDNLQHFGYGIKAYILSLVETAVELSEGRVSGRHVGKLIELGKHMLAEDVVLLANVEQTVQALAVRYPLTLITKGDLMEQETKIERSGLSRYFRNIEVLSNKEHEAYQTLLRKYGVQPEQFVMVGNSLRSDIWPVLELGATAIYVPHHRTWAHEVVEPPEPGHPGFYQLVHIGQLTALIEKLEAE